MSEAIRVLIVDDSSMIRGLLKRVLNRVEGIEVSAMAEDGQEAVKSIAADPPDIVTLDVEMPIMDGIETLKAIRGRWPKLPVIMFSSRTARGAGMTIDALLAGANACVLKPSTSNGLPEAKQLIVDDLVPHIHALVARQRKPIPVSASRPAPPPEVRLREPGKARPTILLIGSSTGGPNALAQVLCGLPPSFSLPVVIAQHMPPVFTHLLAKRLSTESRFTVREAEDGVALSRGDVWIAPGDFHVVLEDSLTKGTLLRLNQDPPVNSCRPAVDVLFESAAAVVGRSVFGVMLTGMGADGLVGCRHIVEAGGTVIAQDEATSVVWGMPGAVARAGLASEILPLEQMAKAIDRYATSPSPLLAAAGA